MSSAGIATLDPFSVEDPIRFVDRSQPDSILIFLAVLGSSVIPMRVLESDSVASVKLRIQSSKGFVVKKQKLVFHGRELARCESRVRDYGVSDGNVLHLVIWLSDLRLITVKTACGRKFRFQVERSRNVAYLKEQITEKGGSFVDLDEQRLICDGEELDDQSTVDDICKQQDAVVHLLIRKSAKIRSRHVDRDFELSVVAEPPDTKLSPGIQEMVQLAMHGLEKGNMPVISAEGSGGAYFMQDESGTKYVAVFKPIDEEPMAENNPRGLPLSLNGEGLKRGTRVGEGALREVAAYVLDHPVNGRRSLGSDEIGFSGVPPTAMVRCVEGGKKGFKIGSLQKFVKNCGSCEEMGPRGFPVEEVHKIAVLDLRLANADRHAGNVLVCKEGEEGRCVLVPIDHGYCLPENFEDCTFEWLYWPQARQPFGSETMDYIRSLDADEDINLLKLYGWELSLECSRTLRISTMLLKKGADRGLTPYGIGSMLCRETLKKESEIEKIVGEATDAVLPGSSENAFLEAVSEIMDRKLDGLAF